MKHPGAVVVIPVRRMVGWCSSASFALPVGQAFLELPAGKIDPGEDIPLRPARIAGETGYVTEDWRYLGVMHPASAIPTSASRSSLPGLEPRGACLG